MDEWYYFENDTLGWNKIFDLDISNDGGFIGTGDCNTNNVNGIFGGYSAAWVLKLDACGDIEWNGCPGGVGVVEAENKNSNRVLHSPIHFHHPSNLKFPRAQSKL
ncbi:MAG: hypothetical protein SH856_06170 [Flavobacteriales bacterium]|nr:hypothetical protein [Flavobacteriales bacterium]